MKRDELAARTRLAESIRRLGHALVSHHPDDETLAAATGAVDGLLERVTAAGPRDRLADYLDDGPLHEAMRSGRMAEFFRERSGSMFPDSFVSGVINPFGIGVVYHYEGDDAVARVTLGDAYEGAPGRAHGGVVAAVLDETMGMVLPLTGEFAFTGSMNVVYEGPTPIRVPVEFRARLRGRDGRKLFIEAEASHDGQRFARAEATFITVDSYSDLVG